MDSRAGTNPGTRLRINTGERKGLTPVDKCILVTGIVSLLVISFYILRPVAWAVEDRLVEFYRVDTEESETEASTMLPDEKVLSGEGHVEEGVTARAADVAPLNKESEKESESEKQESAAQPEKEDEPPEPRLEEEKKPVEVQPAAVEESFAKGVRAIIHEGKPLLDILKQPIWTKPPPDTPLPNKEEFKLRREMVEVRAKENVIVVTFANFAFMDFVTNLVKHLTDLGVSNILVGAMDHKILEGLFREGVPVFDLESGMPDIDAGWGTPLFHKMGREKVTLVNVFLSMGFELFICDTDVIFVRNPLPFIARFPQADILTSSDNLVRSVDDESLEKWDRAWAAYNIGILHFRPTEPAKKFAREWAELLDKDEKIWDQNGFNDLLRKKTGPDVPGLNNNVFWAYDGTLKLGILPVSVFCSGHTYFVQRLYEVVNLKPYALHATFQFAGTEGKRHRFRESGEFIDPPGYYDPPNGLITFKNEIPEELLSGGKHTVVTHFNLLNYQLKNLRQALAIATILNRTLVLPEMWCRFERMWYPHNGILDGTVTKQPFLCPFDHIIEVHRMFPGKLAEEEYGPAVDFREYSFLRNTRTPESVKQSKILVVVCEREEGGCKPGAPAEATEGAQKAVMMPMGATQNEILEGLKSQTEFKLIEFSQIQNTFGGWDDKALGDKFNKRIRHYPGIWCCVAATPGHIYYDFFAADKPGWEPKPPKGWQDDHPAWER